MNFKELKLERERWLAHSGRYSMRETGKYEERQDKNTWKKESRKMLKGREWKFQGTE